MADRDLRKMNRKELLELLIVSERENEQLREVIEQQEAQLRSRNIQIKNAGNLAEAALSLNKVFESADKAAVQYLKNIKQWNEQQKKDYHTIIAAANRKAKTIIDDAENESRQKIDKANDYLDRVKASVEAFYKAHPDVREFAMAQLRKNPNDNT